MMLATLHRRLPAPGALALALVTGLAAVAGVAAIDSAPEESAIKRELVRIPLSVTPALVADASPALLLTTEVVRAGESVFSLLSRTGVIDPEALKFIRSNAALAAVRQLAAGGRVTVGRSEEGTLLRLEVLTPDFRRVLLTREDDALKVQATRVEPESRIALRAGDVNKSLFAAFRSYGVPEEVQRQLVGVFSKQFDLHQAAQQIERFAVAYEELTVDGAVMRLGRVLATEMLREGRSYRAVYFAGERGQAGKYFTPEGNSLDRTFLPSPVDYTQVTSWFGQFRNLRWNAGNAHRGIDYAAPIGTPVRAAGDGVVEFVGEQRGYGNVIVLRHRDPYTTLYAHLDSFAQGLQKGQRILQGEVIGAVGRTGWATGPHLHYEFRVNGEPQDPSVEDVPAEDLAAPATMLRFREHAGSLAALLDRISAVRIAAAN